MALPLAASMYTGFAGQHQDWFYCGEIDCEEWVGENRYRVSSEDAVTAWW